MQKKMNVKDLPESERPYEKCAKYGPGILSDAELLAVIIKSGSKEERSIELAARILNGYGTKKGLKGLCIMSFQELNSFSGIGKVKAVQLLCLCEVSKRISKVQAEAGMLMTEPKTIAKMYMEEMRHLHREQSRLLMFDTKSRLLAEQIISIGTVNASLMAPREIFLTALEKGAVHIILLHNHPSGDPSPSREDIQVTKRIQEAGNLIGIPLMDHIIIGDNKYSSMKENGII